MPTRLNAALSDMLMELGNIGCGRALAKLSRLTSKEFVIRTPKVELIEYGEMPKRLGDGEEETVCVMQDIEGQIEGVFLILLKPSIAVSLLEGLGVNVKDGNISRDEYARSAIMEIGNIMAGSYLNAVYQLTGLETSSSVPSFAKDMLGAILNVPIVRFAVSDSMLLYIQNVFTIENDDFVGCTMLLPTLKSSDELIKRLEARL